MFRTRNAALLLGLALLLAACAQKLDPTQIFGPPPPLAHGVNLTVYFDGDQNNTPVVHVWVNDGADNINVKTLMTTSGGAQYSCNFTPNPCPCEGLVSGGGLGYWPLFCKANLATNGNSAFLTDGNSSATQSYPFSMPLYFGWDWTGHDGLPVPDGTYIMHVELSGYYYGGSAAEAQITVTKNGFTGSATGQVDGTGKWKLITADWKP